MNRNDDPPFQATQPPHEPAPPAPRPGYEAALEQVAREMLRAAAG